MLIEGDDVVGVSVLAGQWNRCAQFPLHLCDEAMEGPVQGQF
jgi:NADH:ubiquinone oxidoreductase subunit 5 (subunit L)/multisubunit Na+/H+ antiporter MnhA subunit